MHPEITAEQKYIDAAYERVEVLRNEASEAASRVISERLGKGVESLLERDALFSERISRVARLSIGDEPLVFGRIDLMDGETLYIGRIGVTDEQRDRLVVDWRTPAAEAFYRATPRDPMGVLRRRHFHTRGRELLAIDDELIETGSPRADDLVLVGEAALMRAMQRSRTGRMGDIVATIQREQDEVIRAPLDGVLVVQGGPGTGKTAVALHRASYLLYTHRRRLERSGVLFVGPTPVFLRYVQHVLPALGEQAVRMATMGELVRGVRATRSDSDTAARVKGDPRMVELVKRAIAERERGLDRTFQIRYDREVLELTPKMTASLAGEIRRARGTHNEKRGLFTRTILKQLISSYRGAVRRSVRDGLRGAVPWGTGSMPHDSRVEFFTEMLDNEELAKAIEEMWPILSPQRLLRELFTSPERLARAAKGLLSSDESTSLERPVDVSDWSFADVPILDEAEQKLGGRRDRPKEAELDEEERWSIERMLDDLSHVDPLIGTMRGKLAERYLEERRKSESGERVVAQRDTFGHVVVDEAQDLSPMQWRMLGRRAPKRSMTVAGDLGQATSTWPARDWEEALSHLGRQKDWRMAELTINYRTPAEIMEAAAKVLGDVRQPTSVRRSGKPPVEEVVPRSSLVDAIADRALAVRGDTEGTVCVVAPRALLDELRSRLPVTISDDPAADPLDADVAVLSVAEVKGLEFDSVVVGDPDAVVTESGPRGLYVAMTRPTQTLVLVSAAEN